MKIHKTAIRFGVVLATGLALILGGFTPSAQAAQYRVGDTDCGLTVNRTVLAWARAQTIAEVRAADKSDVRGGPAGPYHAQVITGWVHSSWRLVGTPTLLGGGGYCSY